MRTIRNYFQWLVVVVACASQSGCNSCHSTPSPVQGHLKISGNIDDCSYLPLAASGQQEIIIVVTGKNGFSRDYTESNIASNTYDIEVPSDGAFTITVEAREVDKQTCPSCMGKCSGGADGRPRWRGSENFQTASLAGSDYIVIIALADVASDCLC